MNIPKLLLSALTTSWIGLAQAGALADVTILDRSTGERLQTWRHADRLYVAGYPGNRYAVELANRSGGRVLAVLSVDGVNAITGQTAASRQSGYVLDSWQRTKIAGWRKSMDEVAAFYFTRLPDSYAARTGRPENAGVIGVAVYREYVEPRAEPEAHYQPESSPAPAPKAAAAPGMAVGLARESTSPATRAKGEERLGTGHGERINSSTQYTDFRRATDQPAEVITVYYDSYANLVARGIIPGPRTSEPRPFPWGFAPDPS